MELIFCFVQESFTKRDYNKRLQQSINEHLLRIIIQQTKMN